MFDIMSMMNKVKEAQAKIKTTQQELVHLRAEGESGAGMVKVVVNGERRVLDILIDEPLLTPADKDMMKDLIVAATNAALEAVDAKIKDKMRSATEGMMPNIPGMDFGNMF
nr:YbaB/EbfC family nucleoid-associated protein [Cytophagales bacterium]